MAPGVNVEAKWKRGLQWYKGTIMKVNTEKNTVDIRYSDGGVERNLARIYVRSLADGADDGGKS